MKKLLILCLVTLPLLQSCQKTEVKEAIVEAVTPNVSSRISVENDYLVFKNLDEFNQTLTDLKDLSNGELDVWENQFANFTSLRKFNNKMIDAYDAITNQQEDQVFWNTYKNLAVVDGEGILEPKLNLSTGMVLNSKGIFKAGEVLYKYTMDYNIINIIDGDYKKLENAENLTTSDPSNQIYLTKVEITVPKGNRSETIERSNWDPYADAGDPIGRKKLTATLKVEDSDFVLAGGFHRRNFTVSLRMRSWYRGKNFWNQKIWRDKETDMACEGVWCVYTNNTFAASGSGYLSPGVTSPNFVANVYDNDFTFIFSIDNTGDWPTSIPIDPLQFCNGYYDLNIIAWLQNDGACCGIPNGHWFNCTITNP